MNKIKFLLCFALLVSGVEGQGQIYIDSYRFAAAGQLLLDAYPTSDAAFSLRKLREGYTGNCITVRRTNGDTSLVGFSSNYLDTAALKTFCGTTSTDTCWVRRWFDQSGNARNAEQTTNANQPTILRSGAILYKNNTPSIDFDGTNDRLEILSSTAAFNFLHNGTESAVYFAGHSDLSTNRSLIGNNGASSVNIGYALEVDATYKTFAFISRGVSGAGTAIVSGTNNELTSNTFLHSIDIDADNATAAERLKVYINAGTTVVGTNTLTNAASTSNATFNFFIGAASNLGTKLLDGGIKEIVIYASNQSANRTAIRDNINTFYAIY